MANYIDKEILAEAYTHLDIEIFHDKERLKKLESELRSFFKERASFIFETDVDIAIEFEEGSLKTRVIAFGSAATVIATAIAGYPSFKEGINQLSYDAAAIAQAANIEVIFRTKTPYCDRLRVEKRKGVFGRVQSLLSELDSISGEIERSKIPQSHVSASTLDELNDKLLEWDARVDKLFEKLESGDTQACIADGLKKELSNLPNDFPWIGQLSDSPLRSGVMESDTRLATATAGLSTRYKTILAAIAKKLDQRVEQNSQSS